MQQIFQYIQSYYQKEFKLFYWLLILLMITGIIYLNYWQGLETNYVVSDKSWVRNFSGYFLLYFSVFSTAFFLQLLFFKNCSYYNSAWFWIILFVAPAFFAFRVNFNFHENWVLNNWTEPENLFYLKCINWVVRVLVILFLIYIIWIFKDKNNQPFYGVKAMSNLKPYLFMLLFMIPLIALASTQKDFLQMYPKVKSLYALSLNKGQYILFESCYGFDFVSIEFFFRGFLILSLAKICGTHCIVPAACFYCTIHLGKPMGEAISSFWGGMLLGIISYNNKSIWGGLLVHLGIAWLMELGGWIGSNFI